MKFTKVVTVKTNTRPLSSNSGKFKIVANYTQEKVKEPRPRQATRKELESQVTFRLPFLSGKIREVITKGKNYPTAMRKYTHRNNALLVEKTVQDNNLEWLFEEVKAPKLEVHGKGFTIDYVETQYGRVVITVTFHPSYKTVIISKDGEIIDFKPQRLGVFNDEVSG
jgi:hypothetical protein